LSYQVEHIFFNLLLMTRLAVLKCYAGTTRCRCSNTSYINCQWWQKRWNERIKPDIAGHQNVAITDRALTSSTGRSGQAGGSAVGLTRRVSLCHPALT